MSDGPQVRAGEQARHIAAQLAADPANVGAARSMLRAALLEAGADSLVDDALLVLSEVVTNAFVHAGGDVQVAGWVTAGALRVEVADRASQLPARRSYAATAGTGRGLHLLDELADAWGPSPRAGGKVVWFEIGPGAGTGTGTNSGSSDSHSDVAVSDASEVRTGGAVQVTLRNVPVLMHAA